MGTAHHVTFRFRLPPALNSAALRAWTHWRSPRGVTIEIDEDPPSGKLVVTVTSADHSETYGRDQVLITAAHFLGAIKLVREPHAVAGELAAPSCRGRPFIYAISLGAVVSIARTGEKPIVVGAQQLPLALEASPAADQKLLNPPAA